MQVPRTCILALCFVLSSLTPALALRSAEAPLPVVPPVDWARLKPADFTDDDLDLPFYLAHFARLANSVVADGPNRGFIGLSVWRGQKDNKPHNARIMENILSLAWFYCADRPWNPYRGHPAVRARLEAALGFWCRSQNSDGRFSEYGPEQWNLAATAFATKFIGETLLLLAKGPPIDAPLHAQVVAADRRAIAATLTRPDLYVHGQTYSNQYGNVWGGGLAFLSLHPDGTLRAQWETRFHESRATFQSPVGYYYEKDGPDFGYTTTTHDHNSRQAWEWLRGTSLGEELLAKERPWFEWLALNALPEPDGSGFIYNRAIECRQRHTDFRTYDSPLGEFIPLVRAFAESQEERRARLARERAELVRNWPQVAPLPVGQFWAYTPYTFLHRRLNEWRPTTAQRDEARRLLPVFARETFNHQRRDSRKDAVFTFVRRPAYYAAFSTGRIISEQQRYGLGLIWTPALGAVLQSQTLSDTAAWGTRSGSSGAVFEASSLPARFLVGGAAVPPIPPGVRDLPAGELAVSYVLGDGGEKTVTFADDAVRVQAKLAGALTEVLPLLVPVDGRLVIAAGRATMTAPSGQFIIVFDPAVRATLAEPSTPVLNKRLTVLTLQATDRLEYSLELR